MSFNVTVILDAISWTVTLKLQDENSKIDRELRSANDDRTECTSEALHAFVHSCLQLTTFFDMWEEKVGFTMVYIIVTIGKSEEISVIQRAKTTWVAV